MDGNSTGVLLQLFNKEGDFAVLIKLIRVCLSLVSVTFVGELGSRVRKQGFHGIALVSICSAWDVF